MHEFYWRAGCEDCIGMAELRAQNLQKHVHEPMRLFTFRHAEACPVLSLLAASVLFGS